MIFDRIMQALLGFVEGILALVPSYELPSSVLELGDSIGQAVASVNGVFPVVTLGACIGVLLVALLFKAGWQLIAYVYEKIPFV